jgi:hypothetical protein
MKRKHMKQLSAIAAEALAIAWQDGYRMAYYEVDSDQLAREMQTEQINEGIAHGPPDPDDPDFRSRCERGAEQRVAAFQSVIAPRLDRMIETDTPDFDAVRYSAVKAAVDQEEASNR